MKAEICLQNIHQLTQRKLPIILFTLNDFNVPGYVCLLYTSALPFVTAVRKVWTAPDSIPAATHPHNSDYSLSPYWSPLFYGWHCGQE